MLPFLRHSGEASTVEHIPQSSTTDLLRLFRRSLINILFRRLVMSEPWPKYPIPSPDHLTALGVISTNWNTLELVLYMLLFSFLDAPRDTAQAVFHSLGNVARTDLLLTMLRRNAIDREIIDRVEHFVKAYNICRENRNWLLHARPTMDTDQVNLVLKKQGSRDPFNAHTLWLHTYPLSSGQLCLI